MNDTKDGKNVEIPSPIPDWKQVPKFTDLAKVIGKALVHPLDQIYDADMEEDIIPSLKAHEPKLFLFSTPYWIKLHPFKNHFLVFFSEKGTEECQYACVVDKEYSIRLEKKNPKARTPDRVQWASRIPSTKDYLILGREELANGRALLCIRKIFKLEKPRPLTDFVRIVTGIPIRNKKELRTPTQVRLPENFNLKELLELG